jgi:16S rRNA (guanine527-N7)-methyltransferase
MMDKKNICGKPVENSIPIMNENNLRKNILINSLSLGINLTNENIDSFIKYLKLIQQYQNKINITSTKNPLDIVYKHFIDSISCIRFINSEIKDLSGKKKIIDVGSGAGFPGIPIKIILPKTTITLLEARKNKKNFMEKTLKQLELRNPWVIQDRAENIGSMIQHREKYHIVLSRAVASLGILCEYCLPLCRKGGVMVAFKGSSYLEELKLSSKVIEKLGGSLESINLMKNPHSEHIRCILIIRKIETTPQKYPRRNGMPQKRPLCF